MNSGPEGDWEPGWEQGEPEIANSDSASSGALPSRRCESASSQVASAAEHQARVEAFWDRYGVVLAGARIPEKRRIWFRRECERFIRWLKPKRLQQAEREQVTNYLAMLEARGAESWRMRQASDALRLLLGQMLRLAWAANWVELQVAEETPSSESIQRGLEVYWARSGRQEAFQRARERFRTEVERTVTALRVGHYSYRTEQTYLEWAYARAEPARVGCAEPAGPLR